MDILEKQALIAEIERFKEEAMKSYVVSCWAESYTNTDPFGYVILENENNKVWWLKTQAYQLWEMWQAAKAQAVPECKWTQNEDGYFDASCGQSFVFSEPEDKPSKHKFTHCCFCGGKLVEAQEPAND